MESKTENWFLLIWTVLAVIGTGILQVLLYLWPEQYTLVISEQSVPGLAVANHIILLLYCFLLYAVGILAITLASQFDNAIRKRHHIF